MFLTLGILKMTIHDHLSQGIRQSEIFLLSRRADPSERSESEREDITHDILHVTGISKAYTVLCENISSRTSRVQHEGVSVVPKVRILTFHDFIYTLLEGFVVVCHEFIGFLIGQTLRIVSSTMNE